MATTRLTSRRRQDLGSKWVRIAMAVLATVGVIDTGSITLKRWGLLGSLSCPGGAEGCDKVLNSAWGTIARGDGFSIPLSFVGLLAYLAVLVMAILPLLPGLAENKTDLSRRTWWGLFTVATGMAVFSLVLVGLMDEDAALAWPLVPVPLPPGPGALRIDGESNRGVLDEVCEISLRGAALWDEVKDRLNDSALGLSGGQQQRLCIARAIAAEPEVLLLDEPCSALDPIATGKVEDLIQELRGRYSVLMVTHNMQQASRTSDYTAFMYLGRLIEYGATTDIFTKPVLRETEAYVTGRFG